ncbi:DegT/DnrJ/EryC1/StrS family aminotransferase [Ammoniphilus resinae]|uniref:dTDP-4-amino-4,6-dideoxygalactose transaminase n=1 Tax=Ammoniphilus resinae TaxID=861532 RepID=A0ABS4GSV3_9BACL|nr:DegT/DnrJ/EryC1/StrS family aminotransferase [Ammoniphilus resinae]MBP1933329.1 dTDP-4-amino-4,6-dideoxygalactose transaminase [Ammoniphilus resinae]
MNELALMGGSPQIPYELPSVKNTSGRDVGEEELRLVTEVVKSGNMGFLYGAKIKQFQQEWAEKFKVDTAVAVSSGTASLHTAMIFLNIGPGDEVLVPAITDMGTIIAVLSENATPVFVDVDLHTQNMDPKDIEHRITERTKAIIPVHLYGFPCDMDPIMDIARKHKLFVVEDCCQAHLTEYKGRLVGTIGDVGCFSFQQSKHMTTGDGGMVITNRDEICGRKLQHCADKGWPREKYRDHLFLAPNYHMTELQAAVGIAQFRKLDDFIERRRKSATYLSDLLKGLNGVVPPLEVEWARNTYYEYALTIEPKQFKVSNQVLARALTAEGVQTAPGYLPYPIYMYEVIKNKVQSFDVDLCPVANQACQSMLFIPWNEKLTDQHVEDIAAAIRKVLMYYSK